MSNDAQAFPETPVYQGISCPCRHRGEGTIKGDRSTPLLADGRRFLHEVTEEIMNGQEWGGINFDGDLDET